MLLRDDQLELAVLMSYGPPCLACNSEQVANEDSTLPRSDLTQRLHCAQDFFRPVCRDHAAENPCGLNGLSLVLYLCTHVFRISYRDSSRLMHAHSPL